MKDWQVTVTDRLTRAIRAVGNLTIQVDVRPFGTSWQVNAAGSNILVMQSGGAVAAMPIEAAVAHATSEISAILGALAPIVAPVA